MTGKWNLGSRTVRLMTFAILAAVSCAGPLRAEPVPVRRLRAALYIDRGSAGNGVLEHVRLLEYSPEVELTLVTGQDIRDGKLEGQDLLVMPGGYPTRQLESLKPEGIMAVRKFVSDGGAYMGTCAGLSASLSMKGRLRVLPFQRKPNSGGSHGLLAVDLTPAGVKRLGIRPGRYVVCYSGGPIPIPGKITARAGGEGLAVYKNSLSYINKPEGNFFNNYSIIFGRLGKGKTIATSFHPEYLQSTHCIELGCIYAVTGIRPKPVYPKKDPRPLRVGFYSLTKVRTVIEEMLQLDRHPGLDVRLVSNSSLATGILPHLDVLFVADCPEADFKKYLGGEFTMGQIRRFLERGGLVFSSPRLCRLLPEHPNVIVFKDGPELPKQILDRTAKCK
ncbi:MAG: hypothetical protein IJS14_09540 [Lentisphaeria bacterium]|nr:hypothetical protein [Lentisphaeria bacterium]